MLLPQAFYKEVVVPRKLRTEAVRAGAGPLPEPVKHALESVLSIRRVGLKAFAVLVLDILEGLLAPTLLTVIKIPLIQEGDSAMTKSAEGTGFKDLP